MKEVIVAEHPTSERTQIVLLASVLPTPVNCRYDSIEDEAVASVNGKVPRELADLVTIFDSSSSPMVNVVTERGTRHVERTRQARAMKPPRKKLRKFFF